MSPPNIERHVQKLRREYSEATRPAKEVPVPVEKIAKWFGAQVKFSPLDEELSGMVYIKSDTPIIGVNSLHHPNRQRFTIAHELGHLILHRGRLINQVHVDKKFPVLMRDASASIGAELMEIEANNFAASLLMPTDLIARELRKQRFDIDDDQPIERLAKKFRVSKQALEYRIRDFLRKRK